MPSLALTCRVIVARQTAPERAEAVTSGKLIGPFVYELFLTTAPAQCLRANEIVELYYQRGGFEVVLSDEDAEQDPDRWCSCTPQGQEFWQILSQWVSPTRLELGMLAQEQQLRTTSWQDAVSNTQATPLVPPSEAPTLDQGEGARVVEQYGPLEVAREWGRASGRLTGQAFEVLSNGTLRCPAGKVLRPLSRRKQADGTLRIVYRAKQADCGSCSLARDCLGRQASGEHPRRVSAVRKRVAQPGGIQAALVHAEATMLDGSCESHDVVWCDLPGERIRHDYVTRLHRQHVTLVALRADDCAAAQPAAPRLWTRAERAHRRLSWAARLARNRCPADPPRYACTVFGVASALATYLGLSPDPPG